MRANKKALIAAFSAVALAAPMLALAQQPVERGGYLGLTIGHTRFQSTCKDLVIPCDNSDFGGRGFAGYRFSRNLALEGGYANLGTAKANGTIGGVPANFDRDASAWDLSLLLSANFSQGMSLFGRFGIIHSETQFKGTVNGGPVDANEKSNAFTYGAGFQVDFSRHLAVRAEWIRYNNTGGQSLNAYIPSGEDDINYLGAGVIWKF